MNEMAGYPNMRVNCVDVKDCSKAHFRALTRKDAAGKRFILSQEKDIPMIEVADLLFEALEEMANMCIEICYFIDIFPA